VTLSDRENPANKVFAQGWDFSSAARMASSTACPRESHEIAPRCSTRTDRAFILARQVSPTQKVCGHPRMARAFPCGLRISRPRDGRPRRHRNDQGEMPAARGHPEGQTPSRDMVLFIHKASRAEQEVRVVTVDRYSDNECENRDHLHDRRTGGKPPAKYEGRGLDCGAGPTWPRCWPDASWEAANACVQTQAASASPRSMSRAQVPLRRGSNQVAPNRDQFILSFVAEQCSACRVSY